MEPAFANVSRVKPPFEAKALANLFLHWARAEEIDVTPLKLQKLLYFCHADSLLQSGQILVKDEFEAWSYGPVIPSVYQEFKDLSEQPIRRLAKSFDPITQLKCVRIADPDSEVVRRTRPIFDIYLPVSAGHLSAMSHMQGGPWERARAAFTAHLNINRRISNDLILRHHRARRS